MFEENTKQNTKEMLRVLRKYRSDCEGNARGSTDKCKTNTKEILGILRKVQSKMQRKC